MNTKTSKRNMFLDHKIQKIAEKLTPKDIEKAEEEEPEVSPAIAEAGAALSPVKVARASEALKGDPAQPLKQKGESAPDVQELPKNWDIKSLKTDGPII